MAINTVSAGATIAAGAAAGAAGGPIGSAVGAGVAAIKVGIAELAQHTQRLQDAASENQALDALIPAFDEDIAAIVAAFNSGADPATCIAACQQVDTNAYKYLYAQVGKPGTAWGGPSSGSIGNGNQPTYSATCNKSCTAGCCVYLNNLRPALYGRSGLGAAYSDWQTGGVIVGLIQLIQNGGGTLKVITIAAPPNTAYGTYSRAGYTLTLKKPPATSTQTAVLSTSGSGTTFKVTATPVPKPPAPPAVAVAGATATQSSTLESLTSGLTSNETVTILTVVGGLILIITALFGANALRVK